MSLSSVLQKLCKEKAVGIPEIAGKTGLSFQDINALISETISPNIAHILKLAVFFNIPADRFFNPPLHERSSFLEPCDPYLMERLIKLNEDQQVNIHELFLLNLKKFRIARGKTMKRISQRLGITELFYYETETGKQPLTESLIRNIIHYFELPLDRFLLDAPKVDEALLNAEVTPPQPEPEINLNLFDSTPEFIPVKKRKVKRPSTEPDLNTTAGILVSLRMKNNFHQKEVAAKAGIDISYYNMIEKGKRIPSQTFLKKLADFFGVPVEELLPKAAPAAIVQESEPLPVSEKSYDSKPEIQNETDEILKLYAFLAPDDQKMILHVIHKLTC
jgi:transcriptional regulator with XRE-family HTH domain